MYAYPTVLLSQLHLDTTTESLTTSRRAAHRFAQLEALRNHHEQAEPAAQPPLVRRLLALVKMAV